MTLVNEAQRWQSAPDVAVVHTDTPLRFALLKMSKSQPIVLTETAAAIWELVVLQLNLDEILCQLSREYEVSPDAIRTYLNSFISTLEKDGYLVPVGELDS